MRSTLWLVRLSVLWVTIAIGMSAHMLLVVAEPGNLEELLEGRVEDVEITTGFLVFAALFWVIPLAMAFLSLVLPDAGNRITNGVIGLVVTAMWAWDLVAHSVNEGFSGMTLVLGVLVAAGLAILWHVWKWPTARDDVVVPDDLRSISAGTTPTGS